MKQILIASPLAFETLEPALASLQQAGHCQELWWHPQTAYCQLSEAFVRISPQHSPQPGLKLSLLQGELQAMQRFAEKLSGYVLQPQQLPAQHLQLQETETPADELEASPLQQAGPQILTRLDALLQQTDFAAQGWPAVFPEQAALSLEIGCGYAHFLAWMAPHHPQEAFVGLDIVTKVLRRAAKRLELAQVPGNVKLFKLDALYFLRECLAPASLKRIFILFPDPWPKTPWRRTLREGTLKLLAERLQPGGQLIFVSDDADYVADAQALLVQSPWFRAADFPEISVKTKYERKWLRQQKTIARLAWTRLSHAELPESASWQPLQTEQHWALPDWQPTAFAALQQRTQPCVSEAEGLTFKLQNVFQGLGSGELLLQLVVAEPLSLAQQFYLRLSPEGQLTVPTFSHFPYYRRRAQVQAGLNKLLTRALQARDAQADVLLSAPVQQSPSEEQRLWQS